MCDNQTIKSRLITYIRYLNIGQGKFESTCGLANGYVNNIRKSISPEKLQIIALKNPNLNTGWLMTGEGEMLKDLSISVSGDKNIVNGHHSTQNITTEADKFLGLLAKKDEQLDKAQSQIDHCQQQIDRLLNLLERK